MDGGCIPALGREFAEFQSPEVRRGRQKFYADPLAPLARLSLKNHPAFLLFQGLRIRQNEHLAVIDLVLQQQQAAVRVHHNGLARLFEFLSVVRSALRLHTHLMEGPPASPVCGRSCLVHIAIIGRSPKYRPLVLGTGVLQLQPSACRKGLLLGIPLLVSSFGGVLLIAAYYLQSASNGYTLFLHFRQPSLSLFRRGYEQGSSSCRHT